MTSNLQHLPRRDLERLSAYLDGELSSRERESLEARLTEEPRLRSALSELRSTVSMIRGLPAARAPRNYTLTPEVAGIREQSRGYPILQFATAIAAIAFLVVIGFDALSAQIGGLGAGAPQAFAPSALEEVAPTEALRLLEAPAEEEAPEEAAPPAGAMDAANGEEGIAIQEHAEEEPETEELAEAEAPAEEEAAAAEEYRAAPTASLTPAPAPTATAVPSPAPTVAVATLPADGGPGPGMAPRTLLRLTEIGLAALLIALSVATYRMRPRG